MRKNKTEELMPPVHPGEILHEDFMKPLDLTTNRLALELHVPATRIGEIVHERRRITAETALRLARFFNTNAEFWLEISGSICRTSMTWKSPGGRASFLKSSATCILQRH